jgi:hypothetical protein
MSARWHYEQGWPNSCVPACIGIVRRSRGQPFDVADEQVLHGEAVAKGNPLSLATLSLPGARLECPEVSEFLDQIAIWLMAGHLLIVTVFGPRYVRHLGPFPAARPSRHGALAPPGDFGGPFHAVVLIDLAEEGFLLLDPYHPAAGQPIFVSDEVLLDVCTCQVVVA